jgi:hypothetical protein
LVAQGGWDCDKKAGVDDGVIETTKTKTKSTKERGAAKAEIASEKERHTKRKNSSGQVAPWSCG